MMEEIFARHRNVAFSFSGGKDSLVCLHLLRPWLDRVTIYWMNPGNPFPETVEIMRRVRADVPNFKEIHGRQKEIIDLDGWPSDVVPHRYTSDGNTVFGATEFKVQSRLSCCFRSLMLPTYQAMVADGVTCCIRGKRHDEDDRTGIQSGYLSPNGMELVFPIYHWTSDDVIAYLNANGIELPGSYRYAKHSLDCMDCTAWWGEGLSYYLAEKYPSEFVEYRRRILLIKRAVEDQMSKCEV